MSETQYEQMEGGSKDSVVTLARIFIHFRIIRGGGG